MLTALITIVHVLVCSVLIIVVLLQHGKSADIAATFGGAGSQTAFGPRGTATLLSKVTTWCAVIFMLTSISLTIFANKKHSNSVMQSLPSAPAEKAPAQPSPTKK
ncbi:MAG TPA: preprotein translocase subunit SecG [Candidatus Solibacter sp.]|jgi:preprotein translocase subunit SecG|nr:preprotein translocase subunit SecG [Candidatus Solibacter sp.]